jgi:hypothetical protein
MSIQEIIAAALAQAKAAPEVTIADVLDHLAKLHRAYPGPEPFTPDGWDVKDAVASAIEAAHACATTGFAYLGKWAGRWPDANDYGTHVTELAPVIAKALAGVDDDGPVPTYQMTFSALGLLRVEVQGYQLVSLWKDGRLTPSLEYKDNDWPVPDNVWEALWLKGYATRRINAAPAPDYAPHLDNPLRLDWRWNGAGWVAILQGVDGSGLVALCFPTYREEAGVYAVAKTSEVAHDLAFTPDLASQLIRFHNIGTCSGGVAENAAMQLQWAEGRVFAMLNALVASSTGAGA